MGQMAVDLAVFDPFVTMHSVSEVDTGKMDTVVRVFAGLAQDHHAAVDVVHHVRKLAVGSDGSYDIDDVRGVKAITDAVRAARILNRMSEKDAENAGCGEVRR
jgi:RecA-family ATPase